MTKVLVSIDERLLRQIDRAARGRRLSRSAYLSDLAARELGRRRGPGSEPAARRAMAELEALFADAPPGDSTAEIRQARDSR